MKTMKNTVLCLSLIATFASSAILANHGRPTPFPPQPAPNNNERIVLQFNDQHFQGRDQTIFLKREIKSQYPRMNLQQKELLFVRVVGKSKHGHGTATLSVGQTLSSPYTLDGNPGDFASNAQYTYNPVRIQNPAASSQGAWQLKLKGNIKIKRIALMLIDTYSDPFQEVGQIFATQAYHTTQVIDANASKIKQIKISGQSGSLSVAIVEVVFGNGNVRRLTELEGTLHAGEEKEMTLQAPQGRNIDKIIITAAPLNGASRFGQLKVFVAETDDFGFIY